jgi:hypothetical protein
MSREAIDPMNLKGATIQMTKAIDKFLQVEAIWHKAMRTQGECCKTHQAEAEASVAVVLNALRDLCEGFIMEAITPMTFVDLMTFYTQSMQLDLFLLMKETSNIAAVEAALKTGFPQQAARA